MPTHQEMMNLAVLVAEFLLYRCRNGPSVFGQVSAVIYKSNTGMV